MSEPSGLAWKPVDRPVLVLLDDAACRETDLWPLVQFLVSGPRSAGAELAADGPRTIEVRSSSQVEVAESVWRTVFVFGRGSVARLPGATVYRLRTQLRKVARDWELRAVLTDEERSAGARGGLGLEMRAPAYPRDGKRRLEARALELGLRLVIAAVYGTAVPGSTPVSPGDVAGWTDLDAAPSWFGLSRRAPSLVYGASKGLLLAPLLWLYRPLRDLARTLARRHPVRIFTFHRVSNLCRDGMTVPPDVLRRQTAYVRRFHEVVSLAEAVDALRSGRALRRPLAVITFDDGYASVHELARPMLAENRTPACVFLTTELVGTTRRFPHDAQNPVRAHLAIMSREDVAELRRDGWILGAHTATHRRLADLTGSDLLREVESPIPELRRLQGPGPLFMAYTFGGRSDITPEAQEVVRRAGYEALCSDYGGENISPCDLLELRRIDIGGDHDSLAWKAYAHGLDLRALARRTLSLLVPRRHA